MASSPPGSPTGKPPSSHGRHQTSPTDLFSSAKVVAEAARSAFSNQSDKVDKGAAAEAAEDLLTAASQYGKLEEKGLGSYVEKAESYLHQYHSSDSAPAAAGVDPAEKPGSKTHEGADDDKDKAEEGGGGGGGFGGYFKMAEGFLNKN